MRKNIQEKLYDWSVEEFGSWEKFKEYAFIDGKEFTIPVHLIPPATYNEWVSASPNGSFTEGLIEVENSCFRGFCVMDGHNRLKTYIDKGVREIKVIFRN